MMALYLSCKENEKCGIKKYVIVVSKNKNNSNEEFKSKVHWKKIHTIIFHLTSFLMPWFSSPFSFHIEISKLSHGFLTNHMFSDVYKIDHQYLWPKA